MPIGSRSARGGLKAGRRKSVVIGILAGVAGGKTTVSRMFARLGARVMDADRLAHQTSLSAPVRRAIRRRFGAEAFDRRGRLDRRRIAAEVFRDPRSREALSRMIHPAVHRRILDGIARTRRTGGVLVLDVPLLLEKRLDRCCDVVVFVDTSPSLRATRAHAARGWTPSEVKRRERVQKSVNFKRKRADYIVDNNLSKGRTFRQVQTIWNLVVAGGAAPRRRKPALTRRPDRRAHGESRATRKT